MQEELYPIKGFEGFENYYCTKSGKIFNPRNKQISGGRIFTCAKTKEGLRNRQPIGRIIATMFIPNPHGKKLVWHLNEDFTDHQIENLEWMSHREKNIKNSYKCAKLNFRKAENIRRIYLEGEFTTSQLAKKYKVSQSTIIQILHNRLWSNKTNVVIRDPLLNKEIVLKIRKEYAKGDVTQCALADKYDLKPGMVNKIVHYKVWKNI